MFNQLMMVARGLLILSCINAQNLQGRLCEEGHGRKTPLPSFWRCIQVSTTKCFIRLVFYREHRQYPVPDCRPRVCTLRTLPPRRHAFNYYSKPTLPQALAMALTLPLILYSHRHMALSSPRILQIMPSYLNRLLYYIHAVFSQTTTSTRCNPILPNRPLA